jgi:hypothetical protein
MKLMEGFGDLIAKSSNGDVEPGLHPKDTLALLEAKIAHTDPRDPEIPGMMRQRRILAQKARIERIMQELEDATTGKGNDDYDFVPKPGANVKSNGKES